MLPKFECQLRVIERWLDPKVISSFWPTTRQRSGDYPTTMRRRYIGAEIWRQYFSHNSYFCQIPSVSSEELALPHLARCELSRLSGATQPLPKDGDMEELYVVSTLLSRPAFFVLCRLKQKNFSCSVCGHHLQDLTHFLLDCQHSEPIRRTIFGTTSFLFNLWFTLGVCPTVGSLQN